MSQFRARARSYYAVLRPRSECILSTSLFRSFHFGMTTSTWATTQLSHILPLDNESLEQIIDHTSTLPKDAAAEHLKNLLGDSPKALEFISSFNARRDAPTTAAPSPAPASLESTRKPRKKKPPLNKLPPPRRPEDYGNTLGGYQKGEEEDYMSSSRSSRPGSTLAKTLALSDQPDARQLPKAVPATSTPAAKPPPSASGHLISDLPNVRLGSRTSSRTSSPAPKAKINVVGGNAMHGASTTLQDLVRTFSLSRKAQLIHPGLGNTNPRASNKPFPLRRPFNPPLHLSRNPASPPRSRPKLSQLRQDNLRERRHRSLHILQPPSPLLSRNNRYDRLSAPRARTGKNEPEQRIPPPPRPILHSPSLHQSIHRHLHTLQLIRCISRQNPRPGQTTPRQAPRLPSRKRAPHSHH